MKVWTISLIVLAAPLLSRPAQAEVRSREFTHKDSHTPYWLYAPKNYTADRKWPLFICMHAFDATGKHMAPLFERAADEDGFILLCPSFSGEFWHLEFQENLTLVAIIKEVAKKYRIKPGIFITGIASGADFAVKFALEHQALIKACSAHSPHDLPANVRPKKRFPFLITCGKDDEQNYGPSQKLAALLKEARFPVKEIYYEGLGLAWNPEAVEECKSLFRLAVTGISKEEWERVTGALKLAKEQIEGELYSDAAKSLREAQKSAKDGPYLEELKKLQRQINTEGLERLKTTEEAFESDPKGLVVELKTLSEEFEGADVGRRIRSSLVKAKRRVATGARAVHEEKPDDTATEETAEKPALSPADERKARSLLSNAKLLATAGRKEAAGKMLEKLLTEYSASKHSKEAQKVLDGLKGGGN